MMKIGSLFDGIGGFPLAGKMAGMTPVWASEIEPFPIRVTEKRLPEMKHYGDIHALNGAELEPVDVVTFGSPCQDLSVAGRREGLSGPRSGLFYEAIRIIREMRCATNGKHPRWAVWENVPGALSSHDGEDFRQVLQSLVGIKEPTADVPLPPGRKWDGAGEIMGNGYSLAWRILDAQYWGVPQRRRRIFLVTDFAGGRAGQVLFECESLPGYSATGGEAREEAAGNAGGGAQRGDRAEHMNPRVSVNGDNRAPCAVYPDIVRTLTAEGADSSPCADRGQNVVALNCRNLIENCEISGTLQAKTNGGYSLNYINPVVYDCRGNGDGRTIPTITGDHEDRITDYSSVLCMAHGQQHAEIYADKSPNLTCKHEQPIVFAQNQRGEVRDLHDMSGALAANPGAKQQTYICDHGQSIAATKYFAQNQAGEVRISDVAGALSTNQNATGRNAPNVVCIAEQPRRYIVRRLTPLECCRLQGFPDGWCDDLASENPSEEEIGRWLRIFAEWDAVQGKPRRRTRRQIEKWLKRPHSDSTEYKAYGNSVAVPCVFFVLAGIAWAMEQEERCP